MQTILYAIAEYTSQAHGAAVRRGLERKKQAAIATAAEGGGLRRHAGPGNKPTK